MHTSSKQNVDDSALDRRCRASVEASMRFFTLDMGQVSIPAESSLFSTIAQWLQQTVDIFGLSATSAELLLQPSALENMLNAIFETEVRPFLRRDHGAAACPSSLSTLDAEARACILAQAVAGIVTVVHRLAAHGEAADGGRVTVTAAALARELHLFAGSRERGDVLGRIERSGLFHRCLIKHDVADLILAAVSRSDVHFESPVHTPTLEDYAADGFGWGERPASDMGVPFGFTIMALN